MLRLMYTTSAPHGCAKVSAGSVRFAALQRSSAVTPLRLVKTAALCTTWSRRDFMSRRGGERSLAAAWAARAACLFDAAVPFEPRGADGLFSLEINVGEGGARASLLVASDLLSFAIGIGMRKPPFDLTTVWIFSFVCSVTVLEIVSGDESTWPKAGVRRSVRTHVKTVSSSMVTVKKRESPGTQDHPDADGWIGTQISSPSMSGQSGTTVDSCPANAITARTRTDGFGAQYAAMMSIFSWARLLGRPFCVSPWASLAHGANTSALFSLVGGLRYGPLATPHTFAVTERHAELARRRHAANSTAWDPLLRAHYHNSPAKPRLRWFSKGGPHLAVHVRRGDVSLLTPGRFTTNGLITKCVIHALRRMPRSTVVHIFSEGRHTDFGSLLRVPHVRFHLNEPLEVTFHHLVSADALIMAKSTLSDCAAFLSAGRVFEQPSTGGGGQLHYLHRTLRTESC